MHDDQYRPIPSENEGKSAKAELYKAAKSAIKLFELIEDNLDLDAWVQAKITKAADYLDSVYHHLEYELKYAGEKPHGDIEELTGDHHKDIELDGEHIDLSGIAECTTYEDKLARLLESVSKSSLKESPNMPGYGDSSTWGGRSHDDGDWGGENYYCGHGEKEVRDVVVPAPYDITNYEGADVVHIGETIDVNVYVDCQGDDFTIHAITYGDEEDDEVIDQQRAGEKWVNQVHDKIVDQVEEVEPEDDDHFMEPNDDFYESSTNEGYTVTRGIDRDRYTDLSHEGLEGPFQLKSGKVVYYDRKEGKYYDRDTDMYMSDDEYRDHDVNEVAPPGGERMVKAIKKSYSKDGKLTPKEKAIAYATAWKAKNAGKIEEIAKQKTPSLTTGTRKVIAFTGNGGHTAEVRYSPDWNEYQVHHYKDGKHIGEKSISYHGDDKQDAIDTARWETGRTKSESITKVKKAPSEKVSWESIKESVNIKDVSQKETLTESADLTIIKKLSGLL